MGEVLLREVWPDGGVGSIAREQPEKWGASPAAARSAERGLYSIEQGTSTVVPVAGMN